MKGPEGRPKRSGRSCGSSGRRRVVAEVADQDAGAHHGPPRRGSFHDVWKRLGTRRDPATRPPVDGHPDGQEEDDGETEATKQAVHVASTAGQDVEPEQHEDDGAPDQGNPRLRRVWPHERRQIATERAFTAERRPKARGQMDAVHQEQPPGVGDRVDDDAHAQDEKRGSPSRETARRAREAHGHRHRQERYERHQEARGWALAAPPHAPRKHGRQHGEGHDYLWPRLPGPGLPEGEEAGQGEDEHRRVRQEAEGAVEEQADQSSWW
jgi:hypothetical protein